MSKLTREELEEVRRLSGLREKLVEEEVSHRKNNGAAYFGPLDHQQELIDQMWEGKKVLLLQGANQIGKTILACALIDSFARGIQEWDK